MQGFWGEVHVKTTGLYQVTNWSYGQKLKKRGKGVEGEGFGGWGELDGMKIWQVAGVSGGDPHETPRSLSSHKLELWPKMKNGDKRMKMGGLRGVGDVCGFQK